MATTTFSSAVRSGTVRENAGENLGTVVLSQTGTIAYTDAGSAVDICVLPAGSQILEITVDVTTAFNSSGTDLLDLGKSGAATQFADDLDLSSAGRVLASSDASQLANYANIGTTDVTLQALYTQSVADSSAGAARITVTYVYNG